MNIDHKYLSNNDEGVLLHIPQGESAGEPVLFDNDLGTDRLPAENLTIILEDDSHCTVIICDHTERDTPGRHIDRTVHISVGRNATLHLFDVENTSETTQRTSRIILSQGADSNVLLNTLTIHNGESDNSFHCSFAGRHAGLKLYGMAIADHSQKVKVYSHIDHRVPDCHSDELYKMSADGNADCSFTGRIHVAEGAVHTEAYQASRNLLSGNNARIHSSPELEIYNDDVKCSHGCAIGQLDETQIFYMQTRGIPEPEAKLLLRRAFMAEVINEVTVPELRDRITQLVNDRY